MRKLLCFLLIFVIASIAQALPVWEDGMTSLDSWGESSAASTEEGDTVGGIQVVSGTQVQMNSWWDGAAYTNMWTDTGLTIQDETEYDIILTMISYADSTPVYVNLDSIEDSTWTNFQSTSVAPGTSDWADYVVSFDTMGSNNDDIVGKSLGIGCDAGWWNNLAIDNIAVWVPEPATVLLLGLGTIAALRRRKK